MRITGGQAARQILKVPKGLAVRPTPDLVKQAVFNSLGARVVGTRVLELFAGSGALSLDCLSRGAVSAVCIEKSHRHAEFIRGNAEAAGCLTWFSPTRLTAKKTSDTAPLHSRSNCSMRRACRSCSRRAGDSSS